MYMGHKHEFLETKWQCLNLSLNWQEVNNFTSCKVKILIVQAQVGLLRKLNEL